MIKMDRNVRPEVRLSTTGRCDYNCLYCSKEGSKSRGYGEITLEQVERLGQLIYSLSLPHIHITGGEPTLRKDLEKIISILKEKGIENVALTTHGLRLDYNYMEKLIRARLDGLHVHLPSLDKELYRMATGREIEPKNIADIVIKASKNIRTRFNVPVTSINYRRIPDILDYAYENKISVSLIELMNFNRLRINEGRIKELLFSWAESNGHIFTLKGELERKEYGDLYQSETGRRVRIIPSTNCDLTLQNPAHNCTIEDNRVWVGGRDGEYLLTNCMYKPPTEISLNELREKLKVKYTIT